MQPAAPLILGYSGGGDSTALLHRLRAEGAPVVAAIVDHALRPGAAADAVRAAAIARAMGAAPEIVTLRWAAGERPTQAAARERRHKALIAVAKRHGAKAVHLAHTLDDQAETVLIRLAAGSGWRGLAAMSACAPAPIWPEGRGLSSLRPMLRARRACLREALRTAGLDWIEDPANEEPRFARVRARVWLQQQEAGGLAPHRWAALAERLAVLAEALDQAARACVDRALVVAPEAISLDLGAWRASPAEARQRALSAILTAVAGAPREPEAPALRRLDAALDGDFRAATLGGAALRREEGRVLFSRDPGGVLGRGGGPPAPPVGLCPDHETVWDGRFALRAAEPGWQAAPDGTGQAPVLIRGRARMTLEQAAARGLVEAKSLIRERIAHLLWR
jgi:tRNA(Ile)-lysidine synthase